MIDDGADTKQKQLIKISAIHALSWNNFIKTHQYSFLNQNVGLSVLWQLDVGLKEDVAFWRFETTVSDVIFRIVWTMIHLWLNL